MKRISLDKINKIPELPGCYKYIDKYNNIIYIGKSKNLYRRINSYFYASSQEDEKTKELVKRIYSIEYKLTKTELDALLLEYKLIKKYKPWFNSQYKRDKLRPYLRISIENQYPTFNIEYEREENEDIYYSFFKDEEDIKSTLETFSKIYSTPICTVKNFKTINTPCLYYSLNQCSAPCIGKIDPVSYRNKIFAIIDFLNGRDLFILKYLEQEMEKSSRKLEFEKANNYKELLENMNRIFIKSRRMHHYPKDKDILVLIRPFKEKDFSIFHVRNKKVLKRMDIKKVLDKNIIYEFLNDNIDLEIKDSEILAQALVDIRGEKVFLEIDKYDYFETIFKKIKKFKGS